MTYLHKYVLILHHQRIGVDVAREWFGLAGLCAVLQLAGYIQGLCPQERQTKTHRLTGQTKESVPLSENEKRLHKLCLYVFNCDGRTP